MDEILMERCVRNCAGWNRDEVEMDLPSDARGSCQRKSPSNKQQYPAKRYLDSRYLQGAMQICCCFLKSKFVVKVCVVCVRKEGGKENATGRGEEEEEEEEESFGLHSSLYFGHV